jgi:DNA-binding MarR family transcriptional regulator
MSRAKREALIGEIGLEVQQWQDAVHAFDEAAASRMGVNQTDLRCLGFLVARPMTARELAEASGLTPGAVTTVLDRLEHARYARRSHDQKDRRRVIVELTAEARRELDAIWGPIVAEGTASMARYTLAELELLRDFLRHARQVQAQHAERIKRGPKAS